MKTGRAVTSGVLVVLATATVAYAYLLDRQGVSDADRVARPRSAFPWFDAAEVTYVALDGPARHIVLEHAVDASAGPWWMAAPHSERADPAAVEALLDAMGAATRLRDVRAEAAAQGPPRVEGLVRARGVAYRFALRAPAAVPDGASYMTVEGGGAFVVGRALSEALLRGADAYRDRVLVPYGASETERLEITGGAAVLPLVLVRSGKTFRVGGTLRAGRAAVDRLFSALGEADATSFVDDAGAQGPGAADAFRVAIEPRSASYGRVELSFGGACGSGEGSDAVVVASTPDSRRVACVSSQVLSALRQPPDAFVDHALFYARADEVAELRIEGLGPAGRVLDLARRGRGWHERAPEDRDLDATRVDAANAFAERLTALNATVVRPGAPGELASAVAKATVVGVDGATETIEVGKPSADGTIPAVREDDGALLSLPAGAARDLLSPSPP